jgi:hypothetical protein
VGRVRVRDRIHLMEKVREHNILYACAMSSICVVRSKTNHSKHWISPFDTKQGESNLLFISKYRHSTDFHLCSFHSTFTRQSVVLRY